MTGADLYGARVSDERMGVFGTAWIASIVLYAVVRTLVVWPTLGDYGVNPWAFLVFDVVSAWPFAYGQIRVVRAARSQRWAAAQRWSAIALVAFVAPYAYIAGAGSGEMPWAAWAVVGGFMVLLAAFTVIRIRRQVAGEPGAKRTPDSPSP